MTSFQKSILAIALLSILLFTGVMAKEIIPYFSFRHAMGFLGTKTDEILAKTDFQWAFYIHITSSWVVILAGIGQFIPYLRQKYPISHRKAGKLYVLLILLLAAPSGLVLGYYANAGLPVKTAFMLQSIVWWGLTWAAWRTALRRDWPAHRNAMIRSYAVTVAAMSLRTESYLLIYYFGTKPIETYVTVSWLSWVGNLILAEFLMRRAS